MDKPKRGVKPGSKRSPYATKKIETELINFRVPKDKKDYVKPLMRNYLKQLLADPESIKNVVQISKVVKVAKQKSEIAKPSKSKSAEPTMAELLRQMNRK